MDFSSYANPNYTPLLHGFDSSTFSPSTKTKAKRKRPPTKAQLLATLRRMVGQDDINPWLSEAE